MKLKILFLINFCLFHFVSQSQIDTLDLMSLVKIEKDDLSNFVILEVVDMCTGDVYGSKTTLKTSIPLVETGMPNRTGKYYYRYRTFNMSKGLYTLTDTTEFYLKEITVKLNEEHNCANYGGFSNYDIPGVSRTFPYGVSNYTWEFKQTSPVDGDPWYFETDSNQEQLSSEKLYEIENQDGRHIQFGATYDLRIKVNFKHGNESSFGPVDCFATLSGSGGLPSASEKWVEPNVELASEYHFYPNPSNGKEATLIIKFGQSDQIKIDIKDFKGDLIDSFIISNKKDQRIEERIKLNNLESGFYLVNISNGSEEKEIKLVVNNDDE